MPAQSNNCIIVAIEYKEKSYQLTRDCIASTELPVYYVKRDPEGIGSLAEAINRGFRESGAINYKYCWFITNVVFDPSVPDSLREVMSLVGAAAVHPSFDSDHKHLQPQDDPDDYELAWVPFIEFTAPMVRTDIFAEYQLDEDMPYWGHDLDWSAIVNGIGEPTYVDYRVMVSHTYLRNIQKPESWTIARKQARKASDKSTTAALIKKWGADWKGVLWPKSPETIGRFYSDVAKKLTSQNF